MFVSGNNRGNDILWWGMKMEDKTPTKTISGAMRILAADIKSEDGVANMACLQAANWLNELQNLIDELNEYIDELSENLKGL